MSEMIRRIAAPIAAEIMELTASQRASFKFPDDCNGDTIDRAMSAARLAIEAMREPTEAMQNCGYNASTAGFHEEAKIVWHAMIDEALK
jgi:hypothetical protein